MKLLRLLAQGSRLQLATAILASVLSGVAELGATICVLESFRSGAVLWWQFALVALFSLVIGRYSRSALGRLASKSIVRMRRRLVRSALHVPLQDLERIGSSRLLIAFTSDLVSVASTVRNLASLSASSAILLGCLAYIGWFSRAIMIVTALLCLVCIGGAVILRRLERQHHQATREAWDGVVRVYSMVLDGVKQLKINRSLARQVLLSFEHRVHEQQQYSGARGRYSDLVATWTQAMFYVILGTAVFGPFGNAQLKVEFALLALLQIRRPLRSLISDSSAFADASVAFQRITELGLKVSESDRAPAAAERPPAESLDWRTLSFKGVKFRYEGAKADFALGPLEMTFRPGELVIVAGGNGSGKTTFAKLFTGLYAPTAGVIRVDGVAVRGQNVNKYRGRFAAIFGEFCLFEGVADLQVDRLDLQAEQLAARLKLSRWMLGEPEASGKRTTLSSGERRRIALLKAVLEDRPIFVFDEWAIDQDSQFKNFFYEEFLPTMRDSGKLIIAISGDETYFHVADRVLWLERGAPPAWRDPSSFPKALGATREISENGVGAMTSMNR
jgi:putative pyoverdin transport system ATP-binding/permease protein